MEKKWVVHPGHDRAGSVARELGIHPAIAKALLRRGFADLSEITRFLNPSQDLLEDPFVFPDMKKSVERIRLAVSQKERILVYGDYDVDGITGSSILYPALKRLGASVDVHIPHRMNEGYGLNLESLETLLEKDYSVVITVDNGITGVEQVKFLTGRGVDVIIVDHHMPKDEIPQAFAILCAHAGEKKGDPHLAACGLAFKLAWALLGSYAAAEEYLDLVALGTIADIATVLGDNRILLKNGLRLLARSKRPGVRALMEVARISPNSVGYRDIAFGFGPRINAAGRMGSPLNAFKLLTTDDPGEAKELANFLDRGNKDRQRLEAEAFSEAAGLAEILLTENGDAVIVLENGDWHEGVLGIVAARLVERFHRPSIVISMKNGVGKGSGRSIPGFSIFEAVRPYEELLENFGGHAQAIGMTIKEGRVSEFRRRVNNGVKKNDFLELKPELIIESELSFADLNLEFLKDLSKLEPFGPGNPKPYFLSKGLSLKGEARKRGKDTLHCWLKDAKGMTTCEAVGFRMFDRWSSAEKTPIFDVVYRPTLVEFQGIAHIQLELEDWRTSN